MQNLQNSFDLVAVTSILHPLSLGVIDFRKREGREEREIHDPQQDREDKKSTPRFLSCCAFTGRRSKEGEKSGIHSGENKGVSGSLKIPELFHIFSSLLFHCKDQNLPRQMPTRLLLVLFCRLLRNRAVFAYLPPLGYFTTLCNIHCSFLLHIWF